MFGSQLLEIVIGIIFIYLLLSLMATTINEFIFSALNMRARNLARGLQELLGEKNGEGLVDALYNHGLIYGLYKGEYRHGKWWNLPSYVPSQSFALALMDLLDPTGACKNSTTAAPSALSRVRESIEKLDNKKAKQSLLAAIDGAGGDLAKARQNLEDWYNNAMDRVSGWYKFRTQWAVLLISIVLSIAFNADTIWAVHQLSRDQTLRQAVVAAVEERAKQSSSAVLSINPAKDFEAEVKALNSIGLPIGWLDRSEQPDQQGSRVLPRLTSLQCFTGDCGYLLRMHLFGWLVTAIAVSLGAPFWFDVLNKFVVVRSTVKPREKSQEEKSKDR
jgi:hypothetical protein